MRHCQGECQSALLRQLALQLLCSPPRSPGERDRPESSGRGHSQNDAHKREDMVVEDLWAEQIGRALHRKAWIGNTRLGIAEWHAVARRQDGCWNFAMPGCMWAHDSRSKGVNVWLHVGAAKCADASPDSAPVAGWLGAHRTAVPRAHFDHDSRAVDVDGCKMRAGAAVVGA
ncbi:hypothetical protein BU16DRAFT_106782 [Lophium mytilinum]|uniref:Uncharacterized protein n=1 Tax=Lophium mytilinum TaxID=390894 RepID=A0A6A6QIG7_9PEZI|nr:hypothetical protein BU16DRAFT_106782 [Lophium mytilinum]